MNKGTVARILNIQEKIRSDHVLMAAYERTQKSFLEILPELTENQRDILLDYMGVCVQLHLRMLELSCKSEK